MVPTYEKFYLSPFFFLRFKMVVAPKTAVQEDEENCERLLVSAIKSSPMISLLISAMSRAGCNFNISRDGFKQTKNVVLFNLVRRERSHKQGTFE